MRLTYWIAEHQTDSHCYSIRCRTKRETKQQLSEIHNPEDFGPIRKVSVEYKDSFDLMDSCMNENKGYWEYNC